MPDNVTAPVHQFLAAGLSIDEVIAELKRLGFDRSLTIKALQRTTALNAAQAEQRVNCHPAWNSRI